MTQQIIQQLAVHLKSGRTVVVPFNAEKADVLNPQIEAFFKALGDATKKDGNFLFQGARVVLFRLSEVAGAEVVSLVRKEKEEETNLKKVLTFSSRHHFSFDLFPSFIYNCSLFGQLPGYYYRYFLLLSCLLSPISPKLSGQPHSLPKAPPVSFPFLTNDKDFLNLSLIHI